MLQAFHLSYQPGPLSAPLFESLNLSVDRGELVCLIGPNGAGKSCLIQILAGLLSPRSGRVVLQDGATLAYVSQDVATRVEGALVDALLPAGHDGATRAQLNRAIAKLGILPSRLDEPAVHFSIGERVRAEIARAAASSPDILLLDEPTNHLDREGKDWLVRFLLGWQGSCLMVCHDRAVIDAVADRTLELNRGGLSEYAGGYSEAREAKALAESQQRAAYERSQKEERRLKRVALETIAHAVSMTKRPSGQTYDPFHSPFYAAKEAKIAKTARALRRKAEKVVTQRTEKPFDPDEVSLRFSSRPLRYSDAVTVRGLWQRFGDRELFSGLNLTVCAGERVALLGPNGSGKTTLLKILLGEIAPDRGTVLWAPDAKAAYLTQGRERLDAELPLAEAIEGDEDSVRTLLACLGLRNVAAEKPVGVLSVGERTKAELVALLLSPANVLLLDEPTNHLDVAAMEALEEAILQFPGAVVFTSHDAAFIERIATGSQQLGAVARS
ncbi:MAG: ABC-F family ATP-binding cassette domain-containing protein [Armatimonadetes bacterium]|nr:ABC-F family ATP-binding cassette domain-containing protein [Armatimonadota bacterium]